MPSSDFSETGWVCGEFFQERPGSTHYLLFPATDTHKAFAKPVNFDRHTCTESLRQRGINYRRGRPPKGMPLKPEPINP